MKTDLLAKLEKALEFDKKTVTEIAELYMPQSGSYGFISGTHSENERLRPLHEKLLECVRALEWMSGRDESKPYYTYYERYLDDGTIVPPFWELAEDMLSALAKELE